jgi:hypothetical protein
LVKLLPGCKNVTCKVESTIASDQSGTPLRFVLVQLPAATKTAGEFDYLATLFDTTKDQLTWSSDKLTGTAAKGANGGAAQDATGHVAFTLYVGAHSSVLYVLDPADGVHVKWFGQPDDAGHLSYTSDTGGAHAEDLDGDGVLEVILPENDYTPSYADGNTTVYRYAWDAAKKAYVGSGCTYIPGGSKTGTDYDATDPKCAAG